jgi:hypothetical protein
METPGEEDWFPGRRIVLQLSRMKFITLQKIHIDARRITLFLIALVFAFIFLLTVRYAVSESISGTQSLFGTDWWRHLRPGALAILEGKSPYSVPGVFNPPWLFPLILPIALLPEKAGIVIMFVLFSAGSLWAACRLGADWKTLLILTFSPVIWRGALIGNIDWLVGVGFLLPPQIGLFFVLLKPQIGLGVALFWLVEAFRAGGWRKAFQVFAPVVVGFLLSFVIFGFWPLEAASHAPEGMNVSLFPYGLPIGAGLLAYAIRRRSLPPAIIAGMFFSPYIGVTSLIIPFLALVTMPLEMLAAAIALWAVFILQIAGIIQ